MEGTNIQPQPGQSSPSRTRGDGQRGGGGRGRGRGQGRGRGRGDSSANDGGENRQGGGARRGGRGGGAAPAMNAGDLATRFSGTSQKKTLPGVVQGEGETPAGNTTTTGGTVAAGADESEAEVCFICASPVLHESIAPCNHRTCHICSLRMRALYKDKNCAHCRTPAPFVIFTDNATKRYEEFSDSDITSSDDNIGIRYENNDIREDTRLLLRYNCPDGDCDVACLGWPDLHKHVRAVHHKKICDLCSRHKKVFTHEHELFTDAELGRHMKKGDDNPGAIDQTGFKGHPLCSFCNQRFYGEDELYIHCRDAHERCFICDRRGGQPQYYLNYDSLEKHFQKDHFLCLERECLDKKFIAFPSEIDLKAHQLQEHGSTLSKDVRRDARVVDISSFDYRAPYVQERRGGGSQREQREGRGRGRGRDPNTEPIPASSAQPLRRDEVAFQRQMAIHSAQSVSNRTFGGQLTAAPTPANRPTPATQPTASVQPSANAESTAPPVELTQQEQARQLRHQDVISRANILLQNDTTKINQFRNSISSYKNGAISATALIDSFFALFSDTSSSTLGTLIREVADLFEDKNKADALRTAWNNWRAINEDYPSLPIAAGANSSSIPLNWAVTSSSGGGSSSGSGVKSTRVLKLKSSTAQSSRSQVSQARSWGSASATSSSSPKLSSSSNSNPVPSNAFPVLSSSSRNNNTAAMGSSKVSWVAQSSSAQNSNPGSARPTPPTSRPASRNVGGDAFPALPPAAKPQSTIFGYGRGMVRRDVGVGGSASNAWGPQAIEREEVEEEVEEGAGKGKRKGNKGKKVLVAWG